MNEISDEELNTEVATKIMNWRLDQYNEEDAWLSEGEFQAFVINWSPATEIGDAWKVVEKLRQGDGRSHGFYFTLEAACCVANNEVWAATFESHLKFQAKAATAPRAISLASLLASSSRQPEYENRNH
jgi:hypothetical protein